LLALSDTLTVSIPCTIVTNVSYSIHCIRCLISLVTMADQYVYYIIIIIHAFIMRASSVMVLNQRRWQSLGWQHDKSIDGLFEKVSFQTAFEGVESGRKSDIKW